MPFSVVLEDAHKEVLESAIDADGEVSNLLLELAAGGTMLSMVDPYGDTIWNRVQAQSFLSEWSSVEVRVKGEIQKEFCGKVRAMLERAVSEPHLFVRFIGD